MSSTRRRKDSWETGAWKIYSWQQTRTTFHIEPYSFSEVPCPWGLCSHENHFRWSSRIAGTSGRRLLQGSGLTCEGDPQTAGPERNMEYNMEYEVCHDYALSLSRGAPDALVG